MKPRRYAWLLGALMTALGGCSDPFHIGPIYVGVVRLDALLADANGAPTGMRANTTATGVRVWLLEAGRAVDSTLTIQGAYSFSTTKRNHSYRVAFGVRPAFVDSSDLLTVTRDGASYIDTLRLGRDGDLTSRPNPFTAQVTLTFRLAANTHVDINVYDLAGRRVRVLASQTLPAGTHAITWDGTDDLHRATGDGSYWVLFQTATETRADLVVREH